MTDRRIRRAAIVAAVVSVATLLAGCVSIPSSGPVDQGLAIASGTGGTSFEVNPEGPEKGASQLDIVKGFVAAFQSSTGGYSVAKQYLSASFSDKWQPQQSVQVRSGAPRYAQQSDGSISYAFTTSATVDAVGSYKQADAPVSLPFTFVKEGGQWRISSAPNGIVLSDQTFQRVFIKHPIYFLDPTGRNLVPDLRWFALGTAPTRIVSALLNGPPQWLEGAVRTYFPDGTQLSDSGSLVTVDSGIARVDLTKQASTATAQQQQLMLLQLTDSLRSIASISRVEISVDGTPLAIPDLGATGPQPDPKVDGQALVFLRKQFGFYANGKVAPIPQSSRVAALAPTAATLSSDGGDVAVLGSAGVSLVAKASTPARLLDERPNLIAPSLDEDGFVWSVPSDQPDAILAIDATGKQNPVAPSLPADATVTSMQVSRDGARIAFLLSTGTGPRLLVAAILRDSKRVPVGIGPSILDVPFSGGDAREVTWVDELTVATLVTTGTQSQVVTFVIGGQRTDLAALTDSRSIVGGNGLDGLRVLGDDGVLYSYPGSSWQSTKARVSFIATQRGIAG
ncbi:LpqB family beta-propeller domain-containing protein [Lacisediminihabitans changchengi]|uniref:GerMN domain-containing protein n=1 Tax=Lacisediminihabitans changchengi TaxID=2787634 RepID=A0A934SJB2_9MICO|nr:LpqB family beta-propeller domain-containing protein [Lacisediminihabitans changchengi]MBK4346404.1 GerMN domain-containing protein [Lacisediminihabitans changchengi]